MPDVVLNKIQTIERCLKRIREEYIGHEESFEENFTKQDSVILNLERASQATIDIATHIIKAKSLGITNIYSFGIGAQAYGVQHFTEQQALLEQLKTHPNATLLFKGSRIAKLEQIIAKI